LRYPDLLSGASVVLLQPMSYAGVFVFGSVYLQRVAGFDPLVTGLAFLPSTIITAVIAAPLTMPFARLLGVRGMGIVMGAIMIAGEAMLLVMQPGYALQVFLAATCIGAFGGMLAYQSGMIAGLAHVDDADEGTASAAQSFALQLGIGLSVAFGAAAQEARTNMLSYSGALPAEALAGGLQAAFFFCVVAGLAMMVAIVFGLRHAEAAEIPVRHYLPFGKLHHRISVRA
jgi:hypothetical protein